MISALRRLASSTSARPGLRVRINRVWTLSPALRPASLALSEHAEPQLLLVLEPGVERKLVGHAQHVHGLDGGRIRGGA